MAQAQSQAAWCPTQSLSRPHTRFQDVFNRVSFLFDHDLHRHPLYDLDGLARRLGRTVHA